MAAITVRRLNIDLSQGFARHWLGGDAFRTQFFNALSMTFPQGEQCFIDTVRTAMPQVEDPKLHEDVKGFVGQEAAHRYMHAKCNAELEHQGLRFILEKSIAFRIKNLKALGVKDQLAITVAYEHFTAILAACILRRPVWFQDAADPMKSMWEWHAAEETEHRSVAFDVYRAIGGGYVRRLLWFIYIAALFTADIVIQTGHNLYRDGELFKLGTWRSALKLFFGRDGLAKLAAMPALRYLLPGFSPDQCDSNGLAERWRVEQSANYREIS
jgi:hypothetical protein